MTRREGLGYSLRNYDPCFNFNADRFCCSDRGALFRQNVLMSQAPLTPSTTVSNPPSYSNQNDASIPLWLQVTGVVQPDPYTFTPEDRWNIWCSRLPCTVNKTGIPCQKNQPYCTNKPSCGK
jgi:hypothetical protein